MTVFPNWYLVAAVLVLLAVTAWQAILTTRRRADGYRRRSRWREFGIALLLLVVAVRPTIGGVSTTWTSGADVVIMIDRTSSMGALDWNGDRPRMDGVRADVAQLVSQLSGSRFTVIVFDNNARVALPFTTDSSAVVSLVDAMDWRTASYGNGSDITEGFSLARSVLAEAARTHPDSERQLYYLGDGEQTRHVRPRSMEPLAQYVTSATVLGYGSSSGAPMLRTPSLPRHAASSYVTVRGHRAVSRMDEPTLSAMASQVKGTYQHRTRPGGLTVHLTRPTRIPVVRREPHGRETYWIAGLAIAALLVWQVWEEVPRHRRARKEWP